MQLVTWFFHFWNIWNIVHDFKKWSPDHRPHDFEKYTNFFFYNNHFTKCFSSFCYLGYFSSSFPWCLLFIMKVSWTLGNCQLRHITWILTDYLASGWLFCLILQTEYLLYFLLVFIDYSKSLWISEKPSDITISGNYANLVNGELIIHSNIM